MDNIIELDNEGYDSDRAMSQDAEPLSSDEQAIQLLEKDIHTETLLIAVLQININLTTAQMEKAIKRLEKSTQLLASRKNHE